MTSVLDRTDLSSSPPFDGEQSTAGSSHSSRSHWFRKFGSEGVLVAVIAATVYGIVAWLLDFRYAIYPPDAVSRMANGFYVLYSRHIHLAAIGFVWNPLTSIADMVPLLFKGLWHPLATRDVSISIVTVASMTGAVHQLRSLLKEMGLQRTPRLVLTFLFALNPMIVYYAANGMSEALYVFTTVGIARYLRRWLTEQEIASLVLAATMLALCYLNREEGAAVALFTGLLVLAVSIGRGSRQRHRIFTGLTDAVVYLLPFTAVFLGWAFASYVITGSAFQQFTSQYGNSEQLKVYGSYYHLLPGHYVERLAHEAKALEAIAPLLPAVLIVAAVIAIKRRDLQVCAPLAVFGGALTFTLFSYLDNQIFPWFRFYILAVPLEVILMGYILSPRRQPQFTRSNDQSVRPGAMTSRRVIVAFVSSVVALIVVGPSIATTADAMNNPKIGIEESSQLSAVFHPSLYHPPLSDDALLPLMPYLESLHLSNGDVVTDDAYDCMPTMITRINNPKIFVITNDSDFQRILADPLTWHAHYLVVPPPGGTFNALSAQYPNLYRNGAGFSKLVRQFPGTSICPVLRLYKVIRHTNTP